MLYTKEWDKTSVELSEIETGNFPKKVFLVIIVRIIKKLGKKIYVQSEKLEFFNKELENIKNNQSWRIQ